MSEQEIIEALQSRVDAQMGQQLATPITCTPRELQAVLDLARAGLAKDVP